MTKRKRANMKFQYFIHFCKYFNKSKPSTKLSYMNWEWCSRRLNRYPPTFILFLLPLASKWYGAHPVWIYRNSVSICILSQFSCSCFHLKVISVSIIIFEIKERNPVDLVRKTHNSFLFHFSNRFGNRHTHILWWLHGSMNFIRCAYMHLERAKKQPHA